MESKGLRLLPSQRQQKPASTEKLRKIAFPQPQLLLREIYSRVRVRHCSSGTKQIHADVLLTILEEDDDSGGADSGSWNSNSSGSSPKLSLIAAMQSLEQEITLTERTQPPPELGYLLVASDDELGIPPLEEERGGGEAERAAAVWFGDDKAAGFCVEWLELGLARFEEDEIVTDLAMLEDVVIDGRPLDYAGGDVWSV